MSSPKKRHARRYVVIGFIIIVLIIAGYFSYRALRTTSAGAVTYTTQAVQKVTITASISGTGNVSLSNSASVSPTISGTVSALTVKVGDTVKKGQLLFTVVNPQLDLDVASATNAYNQAVNGVQTAQLSVLQAQQALDQLEAQKADQSSASEAVQMASYVQLSAASMSPASEPTEPSTTSSLPPTSTSTEPPTTTSTSTPPSTSPPSTSPPTTAPHTPTTGGGGSGITQPSTTTTTISALQIEVAQAQVASAKLSVTAAQAQVESAKLALQQAKDTAAKRSVAAPIDGVVTSLNVQNGDSLGSTGANTGTAAGSTSTPIVITDVNSPEAIVSLAETDVPNVAVDQKAIITFDALPDLTLSGKVQSLDTQGTNTQGVVTYNATIVPDATDPSVKGGMTVTVNIITKIASDALVVPNAAVKSQTGGGSYVQVLQNGQPTDVTVQVGISNDAYTEITGGLSLGQEVVTQTIDPSASTATTTRGGTGTGIPGGGGSGFGGGGSFPSGGFPAGG